VLGLLLRPQALDQPGGAGAGAQVAGEQREQATQPAAGDLPAAQAARDSRVSSVVTEVGSSAN
jgi:hypothetical protein